MRQNITPTKLLLVNFGRRLEVISSAIPLYYYVSFVLRLNLDLERPSLNLEFNFPEFVIF